MSTTLRDATTYYGILPRIKNSPPGCFLNGLSNPDRIQKKKVSMAVAILTFLNTDYNLDTTVEAVQKAVLTVTLIMQIPLTKFAF